MKKESQNKRLQSEIEQMATELAKSATTKPSGQLEIKELLETIYASARELFLMCPKLEKMELSAVDVLPKQKPERKRREYFVKRHGQLKPEIWAVAGVRKEEKFLTSWSEQRGYSFEPLEEPHIGLLFVSLNGGKLHEVSYKDGEKLFVSGADEEDVKQMVLRAMSHDIIPVGQFSIAEAEKQYTICLYHNDASHKCVNGPIYLPDIDGVRYNAKFNVLQFEDFRDGKYKEI